MRIAVIDHRGIPLMPCTPAKARLLLKEKKAKPKRDKLGLFSIQLNYEQEPDNQPLVIGIDPGSKFEGYSVVGTKDTVLNLMVEAPKHVKDAVETRKTMRRVRRFRKWRRPRRSNNRLHGEKRIPPSTRARWEAKARIVAQLRKTLPITIVVLEDVQATTKGKGKKWNTSFSPLQVGKMHLYRLLHDMGLRIELREGWQTAQLREQYGLKKVKTKDKQVFETHAVDAWVLAASLSGAEKPTCTRLWYMVPAVLHRRQLHRLQASKGGERKPYGGTRSLGLKRGTIVRHPAYGLSTVGGFDRKRNTISLHAYRTNKRLTQGAKIKDCCILTGVAFRSWLVSEKLLTKDKGKPPTTQAPKKGRPIPPLAEAQGSPGPTR
jgi:ribosomal protein L3